MRSHKDVDEDVGVNHVNSINQSQALMLDQMQSIVGKTRSVLQVFHSKSVACLTLVVSSNQVHYESTILLAHTLQVQTTFSLH